jgi:hypothetical protein
VSTGLTPGKVSPVKRGGVRRRGYKQSTLGHIKHVFNEIRGEMKSAASDEEKARKVALTKNRGDPVHI